MRCLGLILFCLLWPALARAEPRIALVVGNGAYASIAALDNPAPDAALISRTLQDLGFTVTLLTDATHADFSQAIARFGRDLRAAGPESTGLFYYAGHGLQSFQTNWLLPVDAALTDAADIDLVAIQADSVLRQMSSARNRTNIVILDACRNNPFEAVPQFDNKGLAEMKAPTGTWLAYATEPGMVALDGAGSNSPFTEALAHAMRTPGQPIEQMFKSVRISVLEKTGGHQTPWDSSSLTTDFTFAPATAVQTEAELWASARDRRDPVLLLLYLQSWPQGTHTAEARALLAEVMKLAAPDSAAQAFETARQTATVSAWRGFLNSHPGSPFTGQAQAELAALQAPRRSDIQFSEPISDEDPAINGQSLAKLIEGSPLFPPFDGIPEPMWKGQVCSACHAWTAQALCDQGKFYVANGVSDTGKHPYGPAFRTVLRDWSASGCQ